MDNYTAQIAISESDFPIVADCDCLRATEAFYHMDRVTDFCVMIYVTEGIMYVTEDGHDYEISPGEILFLKSGLRHYGRFETPRGTSWIYAHFLRLRRHYAVKLGIFRETVDKGQYHVAVEDKPLARFGVGNVLHLLRRKTRSADDV